MYDRGRAEAKRSPASFLRARLRNAMVQRDTLGVVRRGWYTSPAGEVVSLHLQDDVPEFYPPPAIPLQSATVPPGGRRVTRTCACACDMLEEALRLQELIAGQGRTVAILDMASELHPGGSYRSGSASQEEDLCRRTDIVRHLLRLQYPIPTGAGYYLPRVTCFRRALGRSYELEPEPRTLPVLVVPALRHRGPQSALCERDLELLRSAVWTQLKMAADHGHDTLVLGAFGCGAFGNPPETVARLYSEELLTHFREDFSSVTFAVMPAGGHNFASFLRQFGSPAASEADVVDVQTTSTSTVV